MSVPAIGGRHFRFLLPLLNPSKIVAEQASPCLVKAGFPQRVASRLGEHPGRGWAGWGVAEAGLEFKPPVRLLHPFFPSCLHLLQILLWAPFLCHPGALSPPPTPQPSSCTRPCRSERDSVKASEGDSGNEEAGWAQIVTGGRLGRSPHFGPSSYVYIDGDSQYFVRRRVGEGGERSFC